MVTFENTLILVLFGCLLLSVFAQQWALAAKDLVKERQGRYHEHASTVVVLADLATILSFVALGAAFERIGWNDVSPLMKVLALVWTFLLWLDLKRDNWFNNQRQLLGECMKKYGKRLADPPSH